MDQYKKIYTYTLACNWHTLIGIILTAVFFIPHGMIDSMPWRVAVTCLLWIITICNFYGAMVFMNKKYFLPLYRETGKFPVWQYIGAIFFFSFLFIFMPFTAHHEVTMEMLGYFYLLMP